MNKSSRNLTRLTEKFALMIPFVIGLAFFAFAQFVQPTKADDVGDVSPELGVIEGPSQPVKKGEISYFTVSFTDPGVLDAQEAAWDWGDGSQNSQCPPDDSFCTLDLINSIIYGSHSFTDPGVFNILLTLFDDDGGSTTASTQAVIYDPEGGFVTGGGWFDSPEGAYNPDPTLTGKATFGFVSKYKKGADIPTGNTEFQFKVADLNFHSDEYQWLVVAGAKAMFKGVGTINGQGNYGFMISAIDENLTPSTDVDLFRIKIWDIDQNDAVVYDNLMGAGDDADPTTQIKGGAIIIHKEK